MKNITLLLLTLSFALSAFSYEIPVGAAGDCRDFISSIEDKYNFAWIHVPETPQARRTVPVFYYYRKDSNLKNPVIFFNGGPGGTSHGIMDILEKTRKRAEASTGKNLTIDFIYMDQRGTGCSTPYPAGASSEVLDTLSWYGSAGIVTDAEAIRKTLIGDRQWKIFGQSFGGYVVHRYITMYPQSISKALAHGYALGMSNFDFTYSRILSQYTVLQMYLKKHPEDRARLKKLHEYFSNPSACYSNRAGEKYCGYEILSPLVGLLGFQNNWSSLRTWIISMVPTNTVIESEVQTYVERHISRAPVYHNIQPTNESTLAYQTIALNFFGVIDSGSKPIDSEICQAIYNKIESTLKIKGNDLLLNECLSPIQFGYRDDLHAILLNKVRHQVNHVHLSTVKEKLEQYKFPVHLYSGELDSFIPKDLFRLEVKTLGKRINYVNFSSSGHEGFATERQVFLDLAR